MNEKDKSINSEAIKEQKRIEDLIIRKKRNKLKRVPMHKKNRIGLSNMDTDYHYRLANDDGDNLEGHLDAGYEFVEDKARCGQKDAADEKQFGKYASQNVGGGMKGYYLRVPKDIWEKDQAEKQSEVDNVEKMIGMDRLPDRVQRGSIKIDHTKG